MRAFLSHKKLLIIFLVIFAPCEVFCGVLLNESWDSGEISKSFWNHSGDVEVVRVVGGDYAIKFEETPSQHWESTLMSKESFARGGNVRVTYKLWGKGLKPTKGRDGLVKSYSGCLYGPWHDSFYELASYFTLEAGISQIQDYFCFDENRNFRRQKLPDTTRFSAALTSATSKDSALTIRVTLGDDSGALLEWKSDGKWHKSMDTRGKAPKDLRMSRWAVYRNLIGDNPQAKIGFVTASYESYVDDIVVENDLSSEEYKSIKSTLDDPVRIKRSEAVPWTQKQFPDDEKKFQFAITTDLTGNYKNDVFQVAVEKLNLLRPDFVITVGDLVEGYVNNRTVVRNMFEELDLWVSKLEVPFYYVPGNHDVGVEWKDNDLMASVWEERYGKQYYHFLYKDVLFVCLNTTDNGNHYLIGEEQVAWVKRVLNDNEDVRWTIVVLHDPLWEYDWDTGWPAVEDALSGRQHTVFAGHYHRYTKFIRNGQKYYILAATGGAFKEHQPVEVQGGMDHFAWVTMTEEGPLVANVTLPGVYDDELITEEKQREFLDSFSGWMEDRAREQGLYKPLNDEKESSL
jgi:hypothetical protein